MTIEFYMSNDSQQNHLEILLSILVGNSLAYALALFPNVFNIDKEWLSASIISIIIAVFIIYMLLNITPTKKEFSMIAMLVLVIGLPFSFYKAKLNENVEATSKFVNDIFLNSHLLLIGLSLLLLAYFCYKDNDKRWIAFVVAGGIISLFAIISLIFKGGS